MDAKACRSFEFHKNIGKRNWDRCKEKVPSTSKGKLLELMSNSLLKSLTGYSPSTSLENGIAKFIDWYKKYYQKK